MVCADWDLKGGTSGTTNMETFLGWLLDVTFEGGGLGDAYIVEGLAEALLLCQLIPKLPIGSQERHCILVAASDPFPLSLDLNLLRFTQVEFLFLFCWLCFYSTWVLTMLK